MLIHIFRGPDRVFGFTADQTGTNLPAKYAPWAAFKSVELQRGVATPGVEADACLDDVAQYGWHVTDAHARITDQLV